MRSTLAKVKGVPGPVPADCVLKLEALNVRFSTPGGEVAAVNDFSLDVRRGECVAVVGESGAGKSQAFLATLGLLASNGRASGRALFGPRDLIGQSRAELDRVRGGRIGTIFQDPMTSLTPHVVVGDQVAEPLVRHLKLSWREARSRALALLEQVHVTDAPRRMKQYPHELSGGMRQRVMVAIALSCEPELLIADEPTTALDVTIQAQILAVLAELKDRRGMAMVLITHDFGVVAGLADRIAVMQGGSIVELDSARSVMKAPGHPYTQALLTAMPRMEAPELGGVASAGEPAPSGEPTVGPRHGSEPALSVSRLRVQFAVPRGWFTPPAMLHAVDDVSFSLRAGEALGVVGESGCGKSTLSRAALLLLRPTSGQVVWMGRPVQDLADRQMRPLRRHLQIVFQDPLASLDPRMTIGEIVAEPLRLHQPNLETAARAQAVAEMLDRVGLSSEMGNRYPHQLSGGQCQRVAIARAMILKPRVLVCDEPLSALDASIQEHIMALLLDLKREYGMSVLFVSHNLAVVRRLCDRVLVLYLGRMMELASVQELYTRPLHPYTRSLLDAIPVPDPDVQPARLKRMLTGEPPSPLEPPRGCVYHTRCPHVSDVCRERVPEWQETENGRSVACTRWAELESR